jgi:hypothetical protein
MLAIHNYMDVAFEVNADESVLYYAVKRDDYIRRRDWLQRRNYGVIEDDTI